LTRLKAGPAKARFPVSSAVANARRGDVAETGMETLTAPRIATAARATTPPGPGSTQHRSQTRGFVWAGAAAVVLTGVGVWWWQAHPAAPVSYVTAPVERGEVARTVTASGTVNPVLTIVVGSYVSGVIRDITCDFNTEVRKGRVCATIDPRPYELTVEQDKAALETAKAQLVKDQASLAYADLTESRNARLLAQGWASPDAHDNALAQRDQAQAQLAVDRATIQQRQAALDEAQVNLGYTRIVSPVDGTVVSRNVTMGQTVAASFQTPTLFLIAKDLTKMQVDTNVSESDIESEGRGIKIGDEADFTIEAFPGRVFKGAVGQIRQAPQTVQNVVTYDVVIDVANPDLKLRPGMTATVRIVTDRRSNVLRVPNAALRFTPGGLAAAPSSQARLDRVWTLKDGRAAAVQVRAGLEDDAYTEVASGQLAAGARVIVGQGPAAQRARRAAPRPRRAYRASRRTP
jgi:HlyD family secretion protein